jgi:predicted O-methyltransferase YrrM
MQKTISNSFNPVHLKALVSSWEAIGLTHIPLVKLLWAGGPDLVKTLQFWLQSTHRKQLQQAYHECQSGEDYFEFSTSLFRACQIQYEILSFLEFARSEQPQTICEIGTALGGTNFLLSQAIPSTQFMVGIDLYVKNRSQLQYFSRPGQSIHFIDGASHTPQTMNRVKTLLQDKQLDLLFIDGDHTYEGVKQDFLKYRHLVREGGIIVFHDVVPDYRTRYGNYSTGRWAGEVPRFWNQIKSCYPHYEFIEDREQDGFGIGAIRYSAAVDLPSEWVV